jgi:hypothetical protein
MESATEVATRASTTLSAKSIKHYTFCIATIERLCKANRELMNESEMNTAFPTLYFTNPEGVVGALMSAQPPYQLSSLISMISSVLWHMRVNVADCLGADEPLNEFHLYPYIQHRDYLQALLDKQTHERKGDLSSKEKKNYLSWPAVDTVYRDKMVGVDVRGLKPSFDAIQDLVVASLYILQPPIRADYANMRVFLSAEEVPADFRGNHFVLDPPMFVLYDYKNAKHRDAKRKPLVNPVGEELRDILADWLTVNPTEWLLVTRIGKSETCGFRPMTENGLSVRVRSIFKRWTGVAASINTLRHAFASHLRDTGASAEEKKAVAAAMCHHPNTSEAYVRKPKTNASSCA